MEYAAVTERVALKVARLEGSGAPEEAYTLATETIRGELEKISSAGTVAILREQRTDERGRIRSLKRRPDILGVGDALGAGGPEVDLAVEPVEEIFSSFWSRARRGRSRRSRPPQRGPCSGPPTCT